MENRIAALEARIAELESRPRVPMKESVRCPMCGSRRIYGSTANPRDWVLMHLGNGKGVFGGAAVPCTAHVCAGCGFTELHANLEGVDLQKTDLRELEGDDEPPAGTPYR